MTTPTTHREHEPSADCWCGPEVVYVPPRLGWHTRLVSWLWTRGHYRLARWAAIGKDMP